jgi:hypothetical protein
MSSVSGAQGLTCDSNGTPDTARNRGAPHPLPNEHDQRNTRYICETFSGDFSDRTIDGGAFRGPVLRGMRLPRSCAF